MPGTLSAVTMSRQGLDFTAQGSPATGAGDSFLTTGLEFLVLGNAGVAPIVVSLIIQAAIDGQTPAPLSVSVPAGHTELIGPFPPSVYADSANLVHVNYSSVMSVTVLVVKPGT